MSKTVITEPVLVLVGPTAIGKTALSLQMAKEFGCEIVSVDSMQVYRSMDIGTAKVSREEQRQVPHHLIDIVDPDENYDAARFASDALEAIADIQGRNLIPLLTGGTGLYLRALLRGFFSFGGSDTTVREKLKSRLQTEGVFSLHEELVRVDCISAEKIHANDTRRLLRALEVFYCTGKPWSEHLREHQAQEDSPVQFRKILQIGLTTERDILYRKINHRCAMMVERGLEGEVRALLSKGYSAELKSMGAIGYKHMIEYILGNWTTDQLHEFLARDTRRYAKRQYTWFSANKELCWFDVDDPVRVRKEVACWLTGQ